MKHMRPASVVWSTLTGAEGMGHARPSWTSTLYGFSSLVLHQFMRDVWNRLITTTTTPLTSRSQLQLAGSWATTWWNLCVSMSPGPAHCLVLNVCLNLDRFSSLYTAVCLDVRWLSSGLAQAHSCGEMSHGSKPAKPPRREPFRIHAFQATSRTSTPSLRKLAARGRIHDTSP